MKGLFTFIKYIILSNLLILVTLIGDKALSKETNFFHRAVIDTSVHGTVSALSWMMVLVTSDVKYSKMFLETLMCAMLSCAVDIDHFIMAKSFKLKDALNLKQRPPFHCTSFALLVLLSFIGVTHLIRGEFCMRLSWILFTSVITHHLRDSLHRGLWFWPFGSTKPFHVELYAVISVSLPILIKYILQFCNLTTEVHNDVIII